MPPPFTKVANTPYDGTKNMIEHSTLLRNKFRAPTASFRLRLAQNQFPTVRRISNIDFKPASERRACGVRGVGTLHALTSTPTLHGTEPKLFLRDPLVGGDAKVAFPDAGDR
jgi:hypothetical protein